jgi:hypothetical protein
MCDSRKALDQNQPGAAAMPFRAFSLSSELRNFLARAFRCGTFSVRVLFLLQQRITS